MDRKEPYIGEIKLDNNDVFDQPDIEHSTSDVGDYDDLVKTYRTLLPFWLYVAFWTPLIPIGVLGGHLAETYRISIKKFIFTLKRYAQQPL